MFCRLVDHGITHRNEITDLMKLILDPDHSVLIIQLQIYRNTSNYFNRPNSENRPIRLTQS